MELIKFSSFSFYMGVFAMKKRNLRSMTQGQKTKLYVQTYKKLEKKYAELSKQGVEIETGRNVFYTLPDYLYRYYGGIPMPKIININKFGKIENKYLKPKAKDIHKLEKILKNMPKHFLVADALTGEAITGQESIKRKRSEAAKKGWETRKKKYKDIEYKPNDIDANLPKPKPTNKEEIKEEWVKDMLDEIDEEIGFDYPDEPSEYERSLGARELSSYEEEYDFVEEANKIIEDLLEKLSSSTFFNWTYSPEGDSWYTHRDRELNKCKQFLINITANDTNKLGNIVKNATRLNEICENITSSYMELSDIEAEVTEFMSLIGYGDFMY